MFKITKLLPAGVKKKVDIMKAARKLRNLEAMKYNFQYKKKKLATNMLRFTY